jgi:hypothetical protein
LIYKSPHWPLPSLRARNALVATARHATGRRRLMAVVFRFGSSKITDGAPIGGLNAPMTQQSKDLAVPFFVPNHMKQALSGPLSSSGSRALSRHLCPL